MPSAKPQHSRTNEKVFDQQFFDDYNEVQYNWFKRRMQVSMALLEYADVPSDSVLDVGCGLGWTERLLEPKRWIGVDGSRTVTKKVQNRIYCDAQAFTTDEQFDIVCCLDLLEYFQEEECAPFIQKLTTWLKPDGALLFDVFTQFDTKFAEESEYTIIDDAVVQPIRSGAFYRDLLSPYFFRLGTGVWLPNHRKNDFYESEWF